MVHFVPTWLIAIQALFMTRAQEVGEYVHEAEDFKMTSRVNEDHQVVFSFSARPKPGFTPDRASIAFSMQTVPLSHIKGSTYSYNVGGANPPSSLTDLYTAIGRCFRTAGLDGSGSSFPPAGIQYGDLAFPIYRNDNSLTTYFRNKEILFMRVTRSWSPGKFVYRSPARPKVKLVYKVRDDGDVMIRVECGRSGPRRFRFKLSGRLGAQRTFKYYDVEPVERRRSHHSWESY